MSQSQQKKILVNGCSHTRALIPAPGPGYAYVKEPPSWPTLLGQQLDRHVVNLAEDGKANKQIVEETARYILHRDDVDHAIIQLTEWHRVGFFKRSWSMAWEPDRLDTQVLRLQPEWKPKTFQYIKLPVKPDDLQVRRNVGFPNEEVHNFGDATLIQNRIVVGTMVNMLYHLCESKGVKLTVIPFRDLMDVVEDPVWKSIPDKCFLIRNKKWGLYNHLLWLFRTPDSYHFEGAAHEFIANILVDNCKNNKRLKVSEEDHDLLKGIKDGGRNFSYDEI